MPDAIAARLTPAARALPDTDWHVEKLFAFARDIGATLIVATHSRYVVDLNRDPSGAALYPGADNTELCPTRTFADEPIYGGRRRAGLRRSTQRGAPSISCRITRSFRRDRARALAPRLRDPARRPFDPQRSPAVFRGTPARSQSRHCRRRELRAGRAGMRGTRAGGRRRILPVSSTAVSRAAASPATTGAPGARRPRAAARDRAGVLHGRGAAVPVGSGARGERSWRLLERLGAALLATHPG